MPDLVHTPAHDYDWHDLLLERLGIAAVGALFVLEVFSNGAFGYRVAGVPLLGALVALAVMGAWCGMKLKRFEYAGILSGVQALVMSAVFVGSFAVSQVSGWAVFSQLFADGAISANASAGAYETASRELKRLQGLQDKVGLTRPTAQIEADINRQRAIVIRATGKSVGEQTKDCTVEIAWAPKACGEIGKLKAELAAAQEAERLPDKIAAQQVAVSKAPKQAGADAKFKVASWLFDADADTLQRGFVLAFVLLMGFVANFGPALLLSARPAVPQPPRYAYQPMLPGPEAYAPHGDWSPQGPSGGGAPAPVVLQPSPVSVVMPPSREPGTQVINIGRDVGQGVALPPRIAARRSGR